MYPRKDVTLYLNKIKKKMQNFQTREKKLKHKLIHNLQPHDKWKIYKSEESSSHT